MLRTFRLAIAGMLIGLATTAQAGNLLVAGSPGYDQATNTGLKDSGIYVVPGSGVNNSGTAVGYSGKYVNGSNMGYSAVRWDASGTAATELGKLGAYSSDFRVARAYAVNDAGTAVGWSDKYVGITDMGYSAVRWDASSTAPTELGNLGTQSGGVDGVAYAQAFAVNNAGTAVGYSEKYVGIDYKGTRAVRWDASGTAATELGNIGTYSSGVTLAKAYAINTAGTTVGYSEKIVSDSDLGTRAVRWDASGTAATELGNLGTYSSGSTNACAYAVNDAGTAVGYSLKYVSGIVATMGSRAVRWDSSGTAATELGNLGTDSSGVTNAVAYAVNASGTAVGYATKYVSGNSMGNRAVRWDSSGTASTELGNLGTNSSGVTNAYAYAVNDAGTAVGYATKYVSGSSMGNRAVIWLPDASAIDLNNLGVAPVPAGGTWMLTTAKAISADGWVAGEGTFDPDGAGPLASYTRLWVAQVGLGGTWTQATGGTWGRGPNWSTGTPAMQVGNAVFNLNSAYTVALDRDELTKTITISAGTVEIDCNGHTLSTESGLSIANGATLKGTGTIISNITNAGTIAPGNSPGILSINGSLTNSNTLEFEIANLSSHDKINVTGVFSAAGTIAVKLLNGYAPADGDMFNLMSFGSFANSGYVFDFSQAGLPAGMQWDTVIFATTGSISVVPEPGTLALLCTAGLGMLTCVWRRKNEK
ncbi:MAG: DUF3466 family protein [Thermoguttaceae bacterium]